jgi:hypothetical protein
LIPATFAAAWKEAVEKDMKKAVSDNRLPENFWMDPNYNL